jgi:hypothetical protein
MIDLQAARRRCAAAMLCAAAACGLVPSVAFGWDADYFRYMADSHMHKMMLDRIARTDAMSRQLKRGEGRGGSAPAGAQLAPTTVDPAPAASFPARLASQYPEASRAEAERVFRELLQRYGQLEQRFGLEKGDVAGSVAAFIAGNYMAYHNSGFPDENFLPLVNQMRVVLGNNAEFQQAGPQARQETYEQMALVGMLMATGQMALARQPDPRALANMRSAAKGYLEQFLKTDADRVRLTAQGLSIR